MFDRYLSESLKSNTGHHRTSGKEVRHKITDETNLVNATMKTFLSHIDTKQEREYIWRRKQLLNFLR